MSEEYTIFQMVVLMFEGYGELARMSSRMAVAGLRKLIEGEFNIPGAITLVVIIGVAVFMYWAIKYR